MALQTPTCEPTEITLGAALSFDVTYSDFPADESWQLGYYLRGPDDADIAWTTHVTAGTGAGFEVRVTATQLSDLVATPGAYRLIGRVNKSGDEFDGTIVYNEHILVLANPVTAVNAKSFNRRRLEELQAATIKPGGIREVAINGRRTVFEQAEYERLLAQYTLLVAIENNPDGRIEHYAVASRV